MEDNGTIIFNAPESQAELQQEPQPQQRGVDIALPGLGTATQVQKRLSDGKWTLLKRPKDALAGQPKYLDAFAEEYRLCVEIGHPNVARCLEQGSDGEGPYIVQQFVDGESLSDFVGNHPSHFRKEENVDGFARQLISALSYVHSRRMAVGNLSPRTVMLTSQDNAVRIIEIGAPYQSIPEAFSTEETQAFLAPEQQQGQLGDARSDLYAFGMLILFACTGGTDAEQLHEVPQPWRAAAKHCLRQKPKRRPQSVAALNLIVQKRLRRTRLFRRILLICLLILLLAAALGLWIYWPEVKEIWSLFF